MYSPVMGTKIIDLWHSLDIRRAIRVGHALDRELVLLDVQNGHARLLANAPLQVAIAGGDNVAFLLNK